jgi:transposase
VHDTVDKTWRHLDFFQHKALLHARLPRVRCPEHGVGQVSVPWARPGSGFTLLFPGAGAQLRGGDADLEGRRDDPGA